MNMNQKCQWRGILIVTLFLIAFSWQSDDAYHAYAMARNLVEGNGFVYIAGERVNASTCPLWTLMCAGAYALSGNMYASTLILGVLISAASFALIAFRCQEWRTLTVCTTLFICGPCLIFGVSGLENCLLFLLSGLLLQVLLAPKEHMGRRDLFIIALLMALLAWTRMDIALLYAPACVCVYLKRRAPGVSFPSAAFIALLGLSPFWLWLLFSTWYYGFPFPNTAYAKLATLLPKTYYLQWGISYLFWSSFCYISIPAGLGIAAYLCCRKATRSLIPLNLCLGSLLYVIYILYVGGDFMVGRHFSVVLYVCLFLIAHQSAVATISKKKIFIVLFGVPAWSLVSISIALLFFLADGRRVKQICHDTFNVQIDRCVVLNSYGFNMEFTYWGMGQASWLFHPSRYERGIFNDDFGNIPTALTVKDLPPSSVIPMEVAYGCAVYKVHNAAHLIDPYGLGDALIARLPSEIVFPRIGHVPRNIPDGYAESLESGENRIANPKIHEFYDHLKIVISGDLFSMERLREIYRFNTGYYSDLPHP